MKRAILGYTFDYELCAGVFLNCLKPTARREMGNKKENGSFLFFGTSSAAISRHDAAKLIRDFRRSSRKARS